MDWTVGAMKLSRLFVYPVKSLRGIEVASWDVDEFGLQNDRRWMVVDEDGVFVSQRELPRMTLVRTAIQDGQLELQADGMPVLRAEPAGADRAVTVWDDTVIGADCGRAAADWLSDFFDARLS